MSALLEVRDLRTWFHTERGVARAVDGVSFEVDAGEVLGIVGESGSGKSVTSLSVIQLVPRPAGKIQAGSSIRLRGEELVGAPERRLREVRGNDIAMIFQEPMTALDPVLRIGDQIAEALRAHRGLDRRAARARAVELLELVGIPSPDARVDAYPHHLSGGQRQRVMIAIALGCEPDLLIADEPTTALDVTIQAQILELLGELRDRLGMAMILITHDLGVVAEVCDRVAVMYAGQIVEQGPTERIFRDPRHPYTEGLLRTMPRLDRPVTRLPVIPGTVPSPMHWPVGCRFHTRCPYGWSLCVERAPELFPIADGRASGTAGPADDAKGRASRCWLEQYPGRREAVRQAHADYRADTPPDATPPAERYHERVPGAGGATPEPGPPLEHAGEPEGPPYGSEPGEPAEPYDR